MRFNSLEDRMRYYRNLTDYKLMPRSYVLVMVDGRSFSHLIKDKFKKPFDDRFINAMNETAKYLCQNISGCKMAYTQSDEISLVLTDFDETNTESFFGYRLTKMLSIIGSLATAKFNQVMTEYRIGEVVGDSASAGDTVEECRLAVANGPLYQFDCKCWNVPTFNDVFAWFLYRQIDCIRNSKQQTAQTWLSHKQLERMDTDKQIELLKAEKGVSWEDFEDGKKYGRFIYKEQFELPVENRKPGMNETYIRNVWMVHDAFKLTDEDGRERFDSIGAIPIQ